MLLVAPVLLLLWKVEMTALYGMPKFLETSTLCVKKKLRSHSPQAVDLHPEEKAVYMHCHCFGQFHETSSWKKHFYLFIYFYIFFPEGCLGSFFFDLLHYPPKEHFHRKSEHSTLFLSEDMKSFLGFYAEEYSSMVQSHLQLTQVYSPLGDEAPLSTFVGTCTLID